LLLGVVGGWCIFLVREKREEKREEEREKRGEGVCYSI